MRILVIGQGGREHALVWKLAQSPLAQKVFCAPGNPGTARHGQNVALPENDFAEIVRFCKKERIDLVVIGPEAPLVGGLADALRAEGIGAFGPSRDAALLEGSKIFCKRLLRKANVPTADFHVFTEMEAVETYLEAHPGPCVVKADGLAAGKGAFVCDDAPMARAAAQRMLVHHEFGAAGDQILIEERLEGRETSLLAITDGSTIMLLEPCQDYKRAYDKDQGPNTGGMGAYSPANILSDEMLAKVERSILVPVVHELKNQGRPFQGVLYAGLMITATGPKVLEFNARFGDPECQTLMMRLRGDLVALLQAAVTGELENASVSWDPRPAVCVVMASGGYPSMYRKGLPIRGLDAAKMDDVMVFHAGTRFDDGRIVTNGGRVLAVTALGATQADAASRAYEAVSNIKFTDAMVRQDIGGPRPTP